MKIRFLHLLPILSLLLLSCSDDPEGQSTARVVYYLNGDAGSSTDFRRHVIDKNEDEIMPAEPVVWLSEVAANGKVLFETKHGSTVQLFGRCETGQVIPVPLPVSPDPALEYGYSSRFQVSKHPDRSTTALAYEGHHAGFLTWRRPVGSLDSTNWDLQACIFDCEAWSMQEIAISGFLRSYFQAEGSGYRLDVIRPQTLAISNDGSVIVIDLITVQKKGVNPVSKRRVLLGGSLDGMNVLIGDQWPPANEPSEVVFDPSTATLFVTTADVTIAHDCRGGSHPVNVPRDIFLWQNQTLSAKSGEYVLTGYAPPPLNGWLSIIRFSDGRASTVLASDSTLRQFDPEVTFPYLKDAWLSPDGEWVVLEGIAGQESRLYLIRRDGSDLRRIAIGTFDVRPVVSDVVPY